MHIYFIQTIIFVALKFKVKKQYVAFTAQIIFSYKHYAKLKSKTKQRDKSFIMNAIKLHGL